MKNLKKLWNKTKTLYFSQDLSQAMFNTSELHFVESDPDT